MSDRDDLHHDAHNPHTHDESPVDHGELRDAAGHSIKDQSRSLPIPPTDDIITDGGRTLWGDAWYRLRKNKLAIAGLIWVIFVILVTLSADLWVKPYFGDPLAMDTTLGANLQPPSAEHIMGTDKLGRDVFARVVYGARISLT
ncbi:MAG: hypothetical protein JXE06_10225, partial [Coriobacteriia bacterium]|nr:hypothetical protein [Coriobacteriia bacterium]